MTCSATAWRERRVASSAAGGSARRGHAANQRCEHHCARSASSAARSDQLRWPSATGVTTVSSPVSPAATGSSANHGGSGTNGGDGSSTRGNDPIDVVQDSKKFKIPVYTVALGTPNGTLETTRPDGSVPGPLTGLVVTRTFTNG